MSRDSFNMYNPEGKKVGTMLTKTFIEKEKIYYSDISQFDNGSIYEEAFFVIDKESLRTESVNIYFKIGENYQRIEYNITNKSLQGSNTLSIGGKLTTKKIDTIIDFDVVRPEIFALINGVVNLKKDTLKLKVLEPTSLRVANASLKFEDNQEVKIQDELHKVKRISLNGGRVVPDNIIYVGDFKLKKVDVVKPSLEICLVKSKKIEHTDSKKLHFIEL
ncbi:hypothetical protein [uncultured Winogradskyella sp.]|uniref:hypothetical protein n=1 Tax=uncultured Winogradskyella sp. TaxID=395353 RepID=UPI0026230419|nr:hypothetical protein [uncultured Winogradskyella sp.]